MIFINNEPVPFEGQSSNLLSFLDFTNAIIEVLKADYRDGVTTSKNKNIT